MNDFGHEARRAETWWGRAWRLGWGVLFVCGMSALAQWGPSLAFEKTVHADVRQVSTEMTRLVK